MTIFDFAHVEPLPRRSPKLYDRQQWFRHAKRKKVTEPLITPRDARLLLLLYAYRVLTTDLIARLLSFQGHESTLQRRLRVLFKAGFIDRCQEGEYLRFVKREKCVVYGLGKRGYEYLAHAHPELDLATDNRQASRLLQMNREIRAMTLAHDLGVNRFRAAVDVSLHQAAGARLIFWRTHGIAFKVKAEERQLRLFKVKDTKLVSVIPDGLFGVEHTTEPAGDNRAYFYLEYDRGTVPLKRWGLKKCFAYARYAQGQCSRERGFATFQTLNIAPTQERMAHMQAFLVSFLEEAQRRKESYEEDMWLFTHTGRYDPARPDTVLDAIWETVSGARYSLLD